MSSYFRDQKIALKNADGIIIDFLLSDFNDFSLSRAQTSMIFSAQCAMSLLLILVLVLTSKHEKIKTLLFFLNISSLLSVFIRGLLQCLYLSSTWASYNIQFLGEFQLLSQGDFYLSIIASCMPIFIILFIELSLLIQIRVVYSAQKNLQIPFTIISCIITVVVISLWIIAAIQNSMAILAHARFGNGSLWGAPWPYTAARISFALSICLGCSIFVSKLFITIYRRHKMGIKDFGPLQIIFIMGCQTLIIPTILIFLDFWIKITGFSSLTQASVVMSLPLSSLWASSKVEKSKNIMSQAYYGDIRSTRDHSIRSSPSSFNKLSYMDSRKPSYISSEFIKNSYHDDLYEDANKLNIFVENAVNVYSEKK